MSIVTESYCELVLALSSDDETTPGGASTVTSAYNSNLDTQYLNSIGTDRGEQVNLFTQATVLTDAALVALGTSTDQQAQIRSSFRRLDTDDLVNIGTSKEEQKAIRDALA
jgi:hypothetical protein